MLEVGVGCVDVPEQSLALRRSLERGVGWLAVERGLVRDGCSLASFGLASGKSRSRRQSKRTRIDFDVNTDCRQDT